MVMSWPKKITVQSKKLHSLFDIIWGCDNSSSYPCSEDHAKNTGKCPTEGFEDLKSSPTPIINQLCDSENHLNFLSLMSLVKIITFLPISPNWCKYQSNRFKILCPFPLIIINIKQGKRFAIILWQHGKEIWAILSFWRPW